MLMAEKPHIVFVDDDAAVLAGLRRMLRGKRDSWDMSFAGGGEEALRIMQSSACDVVVSDFRMPGMDGRILLQAVRDQYPRVARLILSGHTDESDLLRTVLLAHQFVHKPCPEGELVSAIERVLRLRSTVSSNDVRREIAGIDSLPSPPSTLRLLFAALESQDASARSVAAVLEQDPAVVAKVLQVVNSSSMAAGRRVGDVGQAVALLGLRNVRALVLMHDLVRGFEVTGPVSAEWMQQFTVCSVQTSPLARHLAGDVPWADDAFAAGLLLDVGQLVLAACRPDAFESHLSAWGESGGALSPIETMTFGVDHAAIGAYLLNLWGLPYLVIEAVANHTRPFHLTQDADVTSCTALAHTIVEAHFGALCGRHDAVPVLDEAQLDDPLRERINRWQVELQREQTAQQHR